MCDEGGFAAGGWPGDSTSSYRGDAGNGGRFISFGEKLAIKYCPLPSAAIVAPSSAFSQPALHSSLLHDARPATSPNAASLHHLTCSWLPPCLNQPCSLFSCSAPSASHASRTSSPCSAHHALHQPPLRMAASLLSLAAPSPCLLRALQPPPLLRYGSPCFAVAGLLSSSLRCNSLMRCNSALALSTRCPSLS